MVAYEPNSGTILNRSHDSKKRKASEGAKGPVPDVSPPLPARFVGALSVVSGMFFCDSSEAEK